MEINPKYGPPSIPFGIVTPEAMDALYVEAGKLFDLVKEQQIQVDALQQELDQNKDRLTPMVVQHLNMLADVTTEAMRKHRVPQWDNAVGTLYRHTRHIALTDWTICEEGWIRTTRIDIYERNEEYPQDYPFKLDETREEATIRIDAIYKSFRFDSDEKSRKALKAELEELEERQQIIREKLGHD